MTIKVKKGAGNTTFTRVTACIKGLARIWEVCYENGIPVQYTSQRNTGEVNKNGTAIWTTRYLTPTNA